MPIGNRTIGLVFFSFFSRDAPACRSLQGDPPHSNQQSFVIIIDSIIEI
jgi:hypothetical protein